MTRPGGDRRPAAASSTAACTWGAWPGSRRRRGRGGDPVRALRRPDLGRRAAGGAAAPGPHRPRRRRRPGVRGLLRAGEGRRPVVAPTAGRCRGCGPGTASPTSSTGASARGPSRSTRPAWPTSPTWPTAGRECRAGRRRLDARRPRAVGPRPGRCPAAGRGARPGEHQRARSRARGSSTSTRSTRGTGRRRPPWRRCSACARSTVRQAARRARLRLLRPRRQRASTSPRWPSSRCSHERPASFRSSGHVPRPATRARDRHPAARSWVPDRARLLERLAERAGRRGAAWPRVAAAVVLLRGVAGDDRPTFAERVGVSLADLADLELGLTPPSGVPPASGRWPTWSTGAGSTPPAPVPASAAVRGSGRCGAG